MVVEPFCQGAVPFRVTVLDTPRGPQALVPTTMELVHYEGALLEGEMEMKALSACNEVIRGNPFLGPIRSKGLLAKCPDPSLSLNIADVQGSHGPPTGSLHTCCG